MAWKQTAAVAAIASLAQLGQANVIQLQEREASNIVQLPRCDKPFTPWVYQGCYSDPAGPHTLPYRSPSSSDSMTQEICIADCKGGGYRYAGLEFGGECYCGDALTTQKLSESSCNMPCNGNKKELCGSGNVISVFRDPTFQVPLEQGSISDYKHIGCYSDNNSQGRALSEPKDIDQGSFTIEKCLAACLEAGWYYAGMEFAQECYCGNGVFNGGQRLSDSSCNMPCNGDKSENCGGSGALNVYYAAKLDTTEHCGDAPPKPSPTYKTTSSSVYYPPSSTKTTSTSSVYYPPSSTKTTSSSVYYPPPPPPSPTSYKTTSSSVYYPPSSTHTTSSSVYVPPPPPPPPSPTPTPAIPKSCPANYYR
ncbi:WSC domain-containing protein 2 [Escovopsis weberi]|uniref:WSC domain-containing protein 2 n=1 Tax=Escovopsis weberi TaxID=150374 RepID=A0A0M8MTC4_ESCWE|nr:WSC domain-containing protein 2 [Escovopsis weberi]